METLRDIKGQNSAKNQLRNFYCKSCDYRTSKKCNFDTHNISAKHKMVTDGYKEGQESANNQPIISQSTDNDIFVCSCGKEYKHRQGLWRHTKNCIPPPKTENTVDKEDTSDKDLIMLLIKENSDFKNLILEIVKKDTYQNSNIITTTNSHNKAFNLNFFLNETCKDAMNITDFVESIKLQLSDTENVGKVGYVEGISSIIVKSLKELDVSQRPVHCTDQKRETMYIKDNDKWERDEDQKKMHKIVRKVTDKNARMVMQFKEVHPDCMTSSSRYSDQYRKIIMEAMCGRGDNTFEKEEKIIKKISKAVLVDKETL